MPRLLLSRRRCAIDYALEAWLWVSGSVLAYALAVNLSHSLGRSTGRIAAFWQKWRRAWLAAAAVEVLRLLYYLGVPYAAMVLGAADFPAHLGLARLDWPAAIGRGALAGLGVFAGIAAITAYTRRGPRPRSVAPSASDAEPRHPAAYEALYLEAHWAFYRLPGILILGDYANGAAIGVGLVLLEKIADPAWRERAASRDSALETWQRVALLVGMAAVFVVTRNFFVVWGVHALVEWGRRALAERQPARAARR